jgi:hypothetical protein
LKSNKKYNFRKIRTLSIPLFSAVRFGKEEAAAGEMYGHTYCLAFTLVTRHCRLVVKDFNLFCKVDSLYGILMEMDGGL